jgi:hypothetical protein
MGRGLRLLITLVLFLPLISQADIGFLLHESIGNPWYPQKKLDTGFLTQGGHGAILVTDLCAESPTQIRKCLEGEQPGVVISRYDGLSKEDYDWLAVPVSWYFDGVPTPAEKPLFATKKVYEALAERFYTEFLSKSIARVQEGKLPPGRWKDTLAASFRRDIYSLNIKYTDDAQAKIVDPLMNNPNTSKFDFFIRNCSDFAGDFFRDRFEHFRRTNLGDIGFTSPKGIAWSVAQLGKDLPPGDYSTVRFAQTPGDVERSRDNYYAIENTTRHPKWSALMLYFQPQQGVIQAGFFFWSLLYNFNAENEHRNHFSHQASLTNYILDKQYETYDAYTPLIASAKASGDGRAHIDALVKQGEVYKTTEIVKSAIKEERNRFFGTDAQWKELDAKVVELKKQYEVPSNLFDKLDKQAEFTWLNKSLVVSWKSATGTKSVVMAGENLGSGDSDLLKWIRIARLEYFAKSDKKNRPQIATALEELKLITEE